MGVSIDAEKAPATRGDIGHSVPECGHILAFQTATTGTCRERARRNLGRPAHAGWPLHRPAPQQGPHLPNPLAGHRRERGASPTATLWPVVGRRRNADRRRTPRGSWRRTAGVRRQGVWDGTNRGFVVFRYRGGSAGLGAGQQLTSNSSPECRSSPANATEA